MYTFVMYVRMYACMPVMTVDNRLGIQYLIVIFGVIKQSCLPLRELFNEVYSTSSLDQM